MKDGLFNKFTNDSIKIIKENGPKKSMDIISNMKLTNNSNIGNDNAFSIYEKYAENSVDYDKKKYKNDINDFKKKVDTNINIAKKKTAK